MNMVNDPTALSTYEDCLNIFSNINRPRNESGVQEWGRDTNQFEDTVLTAVPKVCTVASKDSGFTWKEVGKVTPTFEEDESNVQLSTYKDLLTIL